MNNILHSKIVQHSTLLCLDKQTSPNDASFNYFQSSYSKLSKLTLDLSDDQSPSRIKSGGLSSTKSKGLSLSSKKIFGCKKIIDDQNNMFNPQSFEEQQLRRMKTTSTLVKTAHSIHYLGGSLSKSKQDKNYQNSASEDKKVCKNILMQKFQLLSNSMKNHQCAQPIKDSLFSLNKNSHYGIKITPPKQTQKIIDESKGYSQQSAESKSGKINALKKKGFLRFSKQETPQNQIKSIDNTKSNALSRKDVLKCGKANFQIKSKRQFLESYIDKPMINSIILSRNINELTEEPQSPVLRLKKRLQLNSINCIYEKETLASHQIQQNKSSTIQVQESIIVHRNVVQNIRPLMHKINLFSEGDQLPYKLYLGQEMKANLVLTVKEIPLEYFEKFTRQLRIYQEIQSYKIDTKNILELIKHSTDSDKHVLLKEPYTETLNDYLQNYVIKKILRLEFQYVVESIMRIVRKTLDFLEEKGMVLKRNLGLGDFVFVFLNLKFENLQMFELGNNQKLNKQNVLEDLKRQIQNYFSRISSGSLDF